MILQWSQRHIFIYKKSLITISTVSNQIDQVRVVQETKHKNLNQKFSISLKSISIQLFNCNNLKKDSYPLRKPSNANSISSS